MTNDMNTFELSEEQLETVTGGSQSNSNGQANLGAINQETVVAGSALADSPVANNILAQSNTNSQSNYKNNGWFW